MLEGVGRQKQQRGKVSGSRTLKKKKEGQGSPLLERHYLIAQRRRSHTDVTQKGIRGKTSEKQEELVRANSSSRGGATR